MRQPLLQAQFDKVPGVLKTKLGGTSAGARRLSMIEIASSFGVLVCGFGESTQLLASYPHERGHENSVVTLCPFCISAKPVLVKQDGVKCVREVNSIPFATVLSSQREVGAYHADVASSHLSACRVHACRSGRH